MASDPRANYQKLRDAFEGREAIYVEKGVLRVRVKNIAYNAASRSISARVEEVPTPGLEDSLFHRWRRNETAPLQWEIDAGFLTSFSDYTWHAGYGAFTLFFSPELVAAFVSLAARWSSDVSAIDRYNLALQFLDEQGAWNERAIKVFPNTD